MNIFGSGIIVHESLWPRNVYIVLQKRYLCYGQIMPTNLIHDHNVLRESTDACLVNMEAGS